MLDYKKMIQHVSEVDAPDHDNISFTVSIWCDELEENNTWRGKLTRWPEGWGLRTSLSFDDQTYHSEVLHQSDARDKHPLAELHHDLLNKRYAIRDDQRIATMGWVDCMQQMLDERDA